ncbi:unnamed protein product, partial [Polarella glacialis]
MLSVFLSTDISAQPWVSSDMGAAHPHEQAPRQPQLKIPRGYGTGQERPWAAGPYPSHSQARLTQSASQPSSYFPRGCQPQLQVPLPPPARVGPTGGSAHPTQRFTT